MTALQKVRQHYEATAKDARIEALWRVRRDALMEVSAERQALLAEQLAIIDAAHPKHTTVGEMFARLAAAGQPVAIIAGLES